jgi:hypothetical protein
MAITSSIINPTEYAALKAAGLISLKLKANGKVTVKIDRGESEAETPADWAAWLDGQIADLNARIAVLQGIRADILAAQLG